MKLYEQDSSSNCDNQGSDCVNYYSSNVDSTNPNTHYYTSYSNRNNTENYSNQQPEASEPSIVIVINERPIDSVQKPTQKIDGKFDSDNQREIVNSSNISDVSEITTTVVTIPTSNISINTKHTWTCPKISCPSFDWDSFKQLFWSYGISAIAILLAIILFGIGGALYGVVNSDYYCYNDPLGISYVHKGCCNVTITGCSYYGSSAYCSFSVSFPVLTSSALQQDPQKGFGLTCSAEGKTITTMNSYNTYSYSFVSSLSSTQFIDCYTNKYETVVALEPYSELYKSYIGGGITCFCLASISVAFVVLKVGFMLYIKWKG